MTVKQEVERAFLSLGQPQNFETGGTPLDSSFLKTLRIFPGTTPEFWSSSLVILSPPFPHPLWAGEGLGAELGIVVDAATQTQLDTSDFCLTSASLALEN